MCQAPSHPQGRDQPPLSIDKELLQRSLVQRRPVGREAAATKEHLQSWTKQISPPLLTMDDKFEKGIGNYYVSLC